MRLKVIPFLSFSIRNHLSKYMTTGKYSISHKKTNENKFVNVSRRGHRRKEQPKITSKINLCDILYCILKNLYILLSPSEILFLACFQQINRKLHNILSTYHGRYLSSQMENNERAIKFHVNKIFYFDVKKQTKIMILYF